MTTAPLRIGRRRAQRTRTDPAEKDHRLTRTSAKLGSTAYMSPEQWTNPQAVGTASDIYSLVVLAYEVLTGRKPFTADSTHEYYGSSRIRVMRSRGTHAFAQGPEDPEVSEPAASDSVKAKRPGPSLREP